MRVVGATAPTLPESQVPFPRVLRRVLPFEQLPPRRTPGATDRHTYPAFAPPPPPCPGFVYKN